MFSEKQYNGRKGVAEMRRSSWLWLLAVIVFVAAGASIAWALLPYDRETVIAYRTGWQVEVSYPPSQREAVLRLRMDGMSQYRKVTYRVESTVSWAPQWHGTLEGKLSEFITLNDGTTQTPEPMTAELAKKLARSYRVVLSQDGEERPIDFSDAPFAQPVPLYDRLFVHGWFRQRLVVPGG